MKKQVINFNKSDLAYTISKKLNISESSSLEYIDHIINDIVLNIGMDRRIEIRGFGRWYQKKLKENFNARNPATNELIYKPERVKVRFRPSKSLKKIINE